MKQHRHKPEWCVDWVPRTRTIAAALAVGLVASALAIATAAGAATNSPLTLRGSDVLNGKPLSLTSYAGKPVVVNLWTSGCASCVSEARALTRFERGHPEAKVIGIDVEDSRTSAISFYDAVGWRIPSISDPSGRIAAQLRAQTLPTPLFLNSRHEVVERINGQTNFAGFTAGYRKASA